MTEPKRPQNAYFLFLDEKKEEFVKKANGNYKAGISLASNAFKELPAADRSKYDKKAKELKAQYEKDLQAFLDSGGVKKKRGQSTEEDKEGESGAGVGQPKKPPNAYFLFLEDRKSEFVEKAGGDYKAGISLASKAYKELPDKEKYEKKATELKKQYEIDMQKFLDEGGIKKKRKVKASGLDPDDSNDMETQRTIEAAGA